MGKLGNILGERAAQKIALMVCLTALAVVLVIRLTGPKDPYSFEQLTSDVTLVCRETGEEFKMPRGRMEQMLWDRPANLDASVGLTNPKTGRPTLFPKNEWLATIDRINAERAAVAAKRSSKGQTPPPAEKE